MDINKCVKVKGWFYFMYRKDLYKCTGIKNNLYTDLMYYGRDNRWFDVSATGNIISIIDMPILTELELFEFLNEGSNYEK